MKKHFIQGMLSLIVPLFAASITYGQNVESKISTLINSDFEDLVSLYKHLHSHPELSEQEKETAALMSQQLKKAGYEVYDSIGGYGVVGILRNGKGPTILVRTDMDALPMEEQTKVDFASKATAKDRFGKEQPIMHACGHDMHMAVWTGTARALSHLKALWKGTAILIAQPAEENMTGAKAMIEDGLFSRFPAPDVALALHVNSSVQSGKIGFCPGYSLANIDAMDITVKGKGGHSASPHTTIDPIVLASRMVTAFQEIIGREIPPQQPAVITVGSIHGGTTANIIPPQVKMEVSVRALDDGIHKQLLEKIKRTCDGIAYAAGVAQQDLPVIELHKTGSPAVYNDIALSSLLSSHLTTVLGKENVLELGPEMYGEDFGRYGRAQKIPTVLYSLGAVTEKNMAASQSENIQLPSTHSPVFIPDMVPALRTGVLSMTSAVIYLMNNWSDKKGR